LDYMTHVVSKMKFTVPVKVETQNWLESDTAYIVMGNFVVTVEGTEEKDKAVIVGAHYDVQNSLSSCWRGALGDYIVTQGADDNTSGTVGCLALLRRFTKIPPKRTTIVVCFDGEEPGEYIGMATGSDFFVKSIQKDPGNITYTSAVIVDMIGGPPTSPDIGFVVSASKMVDDVILNIQIGQNTITRTTVASKNSRLNVLSYSDSVHFPKLGIPTVLLSNVAGFADVPPFYHTQDDTVDVINWETFIQAVDILDYLARLNQIPIKDLANPQADPTLIVTLTNMGFTKEQAEFALICSNNNIDAALDTLT